MKFVYLKPIQPQHIPNDPLTPIAEVKGVGPGYAFVVFGAVHLQTANDEKYAKGG